MLKTVSWALIALAAVLTLLASLVSFGVAYREARDEFGVGGPTLSDVASWKPEVATAIRARRATASAYATGWSLLLLIVTLIPYRRGERWAWWAILCATVVPLGLTLLRVPLLGTRLGAATALIQAGVIVVGLLFDVGRLKR
jgi:uncharacterized membrane protein